LSKALFIVSGGVEALPAVKLAKDLGLHVVVSDMNPKAPAIAVADDFLLASAYDVEETVDAARRYHQGVRRLDGVMCIASDVPLTVASVAAELGLPGIPVEAAKLAMDKLAMKQKFASDGVPIPWFSQIDSVAHLRQLVAEQGLPLVIKPVDSRGSRGVLRLTDDVDLEWAYEAAREHSPTDRVMLERFLAGPQASTESLIVDGTAYTLGFSDRNYELLERYAPNIIENGGQLPSALSDETQAAVRKLVESAAKSMGIRNGVVKGDIVVPDGMPHVIEMAARLSGGYFCTHEIPLNTGVDFVGAAIRQALGEVISADELSPKFNRPVAQRYLLPGAGRIKAISGREAASSMPGIESLMITASPGDLMRTPTDSNCSAAMAIATGSTREEAISRADEAINSLQVEMEDT